MQSTPQDNKPFAEIIQSSVETWKAQCWEWDQAPALGTLVTTTSNDRTMYGIVYAVATGSDDPMRQPIAYKKNEAQLRSEQPQIFEFLQTICSCLPLGYQENNQWFYHLPGQPPKIHAFVSRPSAQLKKQFLADDRYLAPLFAGANQVGNIDELLLGLIKEQNQITAWDSKRFHQFFSAYTHATGVDYRHLRTLIERAQQLVNCPE